MAQWCPCIAYARIAASIDSKGLSDSFKGKRGTAFQCFLWMCMSIPLPVFAGRAHVTAHGVCWFRPPSPGPRNATPRPCLAQLAAAVAWRQRADMIEVLQIEDNKESPEIMGLLCYGCLSCIMAQVHLNPPPA